MDLESDTTMATDDDLTCRELVELVTDYLEGALSPAERHRFERHLGSCMVCPYYLEQLRTTVRVLGRLGEDDVPEPARAALLAAFRAWKTA
jgi:anti-sigma factor RsiW